MNNTQQINRKIHNIQFVYPDWHKIILLFYCVLFIVYFLKV